MPVRFNTRTPWGLRWTSLLCQYLLCFRCLWHVSNCLVLEKCHDAHCCTLLPRWSITLAGVCFLRIQCPLVGCHDALSPTEVVQLDVLLSLVLGVWHCNKDLNVSVDLSLELFHLFLWRLTIWQYSMFLTFLGCLLSTLKHLEGFGLKKLKQYLSCLMDFVCVVGSLQLRLEPHARSNENSNWAEAIVTSPVK